MRAWSDKGLNRLYTALLSLDKNIQRVQAIADGRLVSIPSKELKGRK